MYGWRARIGHIHPSPGTVDFVEFHRAAPEGVLFVTTTVHNQGLDVEWAKRMEEQLERAARDMASAAVSLIVVAGTPLGFYRGPNTDKEISARLQGITGIPTTTMATALSVALRALQVSKVAVGTPYDSSMNELLEAFLGAGGVKVEAIKGLSLSTPLEVGRQDPTVAYRLGKEVAALAPNAEAILLASGNLRTIEILDSLERDTGKYALSSNSATLWHSLRLVGIQDTIPGYGKLLTLPGSPAGVGV